MKHKQDQWVMTIESQVSQYVLQIMDLFIL